MPSAEKVALRATCTDRVTRGWDLQVQSTVSMQSLQPKVREIQSRYKGKDQQEMQIQIGQLYKDAGVNPLAGCLPTLATLPVWIGLYR